MTEQQQKEFESVTRPVAHAPVAWQFKDSITDDWCNFMNEEHRKNTIEDGRWEIRALYTHPAPQKAAQPVDDLVIWECKAGGLKRLSQKIYDKQSDAIKRWYSRIPTPQVPMTDDEIYQMYSEPCSDKEMIEFARAIEAHHGIRVKS